MKASAKMPKKAIKIIDPYLPQNGNFGYRVSRYELDLEYKVAINRLSGTATITAVTLTELQEFTLDLSDALSVSKVLVNGKRVARFASRNGKLRIGLTSKLATGVAFSVLVRYSGAPRPLQTLWGEVGFEELTEGALVAGQPNGAASWFPCNDHPSAKAAFRIQISTESSYRAIANGKLVGQRVRASQTVWTYEQPEPTSTYLITLQVGVYVMARMSRSPVPIRAALPERLRCEFDRDRKSVV